MSQAQAAAGSGAGAGGGKKEAVQMAKREKRMKLQKAMECFRKVRVRQARIAATRRGRACHSWPVPQCRCAAQQTYFVPVASAMCGAG